MKRSVVRLSVRPIIRPPHAAAAGLLLLARRVIAKFHYTDTDTDPTRTGPDQTKSAHIVGYELNSTTRTRHGPDRTRTDPHGLFCGETPLGPCGSGRARVVEFSYK